MKYRKLHPWGVGPAEAKKIHEDLKDRIDYENSIDLKDIATIAAPKKKMIDRIKIL